MASSTIEGGCQCGAVRYRVTGAATMTALCHCSMCRRASGAPAVAWALFADDQVAFTGATPKAYESSPGCRRGFCANCGSPISFTADYIPGLVDLTIGSMDDPDQVAPALHYWESERVSWLHVADDLPRYPEFPPPPGS